MGNDYSIAKGRYKAIKKREYNYLLCLFIFEKLDKSIEISGIETLISSEFASYKSNKNIIDKYNKFLQDITNEKNKSLNDIMKEAFRNLNIVKNKVGFKKFKNDLCTNYDDDFISEDNFIAIYKKDNEDRCCGYCGVSEKQIELLISKGEIRTKRLSTRGKKLEIDRVRPHELYSKDNIILSCYWCNNAKTDEFTLDEFELIAKGMNNVFSKRLNVDIKFPNYDNYKQT